MPSGAKKRKAAKKKKENQPNNKSRETSTSTHSLGKEETKHQEDDIGDVTSLKAEEILGKEEELIEKEMGSSNHSSAERSRIDNGEKGTVAEEGIVPVERHLKIDDGLDGKDEGIEGKNYVRGSCGSSSSKSNSSCDENQGLVKNCEAAGDIGIPLVINSSATIGEPDELVPVNVAAADSEKISVLMKQAEEGILCPQDISGDPYVAESIIKEKRVERLIHVDEKGGNSSNSRKAASEREDGEIAHTVENIRATHDQKECVAEEYDYRLSVPQNTSATTADNRAEHERGHGITESIVVPSPRLEQKTSWKSCCGMFDVFSRTGE